MVGRSRLSGSLPLSMAVHLGAVLLMIVIPLTTEVGLPDLPAIVPPYVLVMAAPPPPVERRSPTPPSSPSPVSRDAAPVRAPDRIVPETTPPGPATPDLPLGEASPGDLGAIVDGPGRVASVMTPPPPPKPAGPIRVSELLQPPRKVVDVRPTYPVIARDAHIEGVVVLEAVLDRTGRVDQLRVVKSVPLLDRAALDAVRQWRYTPSVLNGQPVAVLMTVTIRFTLQQ